MSDSIRFRLRSGAVILALALALVAGAAGADSAASMDEPDRASEASADAFEQWEDQNPWRYGTEAIFGLTRGLPAAGVDGAPRFALYVVTVPLDLAQLPFALIAGLFGN